MEAKQRKRLLTLPQNSTRIFRIIAAIVVLALFIWRVGAWRLSRSSVADTWLRLSVSGLIIGGMYALIAIGYTLVYGILFMINFAHGEVMMIGSFGGYFVFEAFNAIPVTQRRRRASFIFKFLSGYCNFISIFSGNGNLRFIRLFFRKNRLSTLARRTRVWFR